MEVIDTNQLFMCLDHFLSNFHVRKIGISIVFYIVRICKMQIVKCYFP